jgi:zinc finger-like protein
VVLVVAILYWRMEADDDDVVFPVVEPLAGVSLSDAPILLFVCFHKALRSELVHLRRAAAEASEEAESESHGRELVLEILRRFEFLNLVYKYHSATEDEVVLPCFGFF